MALYDYGNTRLRARISRLQSIQTLENFSDLTSIDSLISALTKTPYQASIEAALTYAHGYSCVAEAMRRELHQIADDLNRFYDGDARQKIGGIFKRNDLLNIKAILRGLSHESRLEDITNSLFPMGTIPDPILVQIAKSKDVLEAISRIVVYQLPMAKPLMELKARQHDLTSSQIELALERWYFSQIRSDYSGNSEEDRILKRYYAIEADIVNLNIVLRFVNSSDAYTKISGVREFLVDEGNISQRRLITLSRMASVEQVMHSLNNSIYGGYLRKALANFNETKHLSEFENQMRLYILNWMSSLLKLYPLGIGVPLGYAVMKQSEIRNLRWIAKGIQSSFAPEYIKDNLEHIQ